jgi:hypothetical protein
MCDIAADSAPPGMKNTLNRDDHTYIVMGMDAKAAVVGVLDDDARMPLLSRQPCIPPIPLPVRRSQSLCKRGKPRCHSSGCTSLRIRICQ